jgi:hypothetical protein
LFIKVELSELSTKKAIIRQWSTFQHFAALPPPTVGRFAEGAVRGKHLRSLRPAAAANHRFDFREGFYAEIDVEVRLYITFARVLQNCLNFI